MSATPTVALAALGDIPDYRVCPEDTDPRGWQIVDSNNVAIGKITDLIIDLEGLIARYIVCAIERGEHRSVLIPTGFVRIAKETCSAHLDFVTVEDIAKLPAFHGLPLSAHDAAETEKVLTGVTPKAPEAKIVRRTEERRNPS